ncbi:MAG: response regulator [Bacteroidetes bacterium]|nr:response regulator [Bacteroidota bacterium]
MAEQFHFILADDDVDDRFFFEKAIKKLHLPTKFSFAEDGVELMEFLNANIHKLPDVVFLDLNMPRKNGAECLLEIKQNPAFKDMVVIIYSTSQHNDVADVLYDNGAHYYIRKPDYYTLEKVLQHVLTLLIEKKLGRPQRDKFVLMLKAA